MSQHDQHPDAPAQAFATRVIHAGQAPDPSTGAIMPPIYANSTYIQESPGVHKGLDYGRSHNPTRWALERCVADLEGGTQAFAFASGLAAISSVLELLDAGSHIVSGNDLYGGTFRLFERVRRRSAGHRFSFVDPTDLQAFEAALTPETRMVWVETPSNPLLRLTDLRAIAQLCRARGIISVADNTFASPYIQHPLELGFDVVVHSTTKYLNGHSDVIGGIAIVGDNPDQRLRQVGLQVLQRLDAHRQADQRVTNAQVGAGFRRDAGVGHDRRMLDQAFHPAQALRQGEDPHVLQEAPGAGQVATQVEGDHPAEATHLPFRQLMLRVRSQAGVVDPRRPGHW